MRGPNYRRFFEWWWLFNSLNGRSELELDYYGGYSRQPYSYCEFSILLLEASRAAFEIRVIICSFRKFANGEDIRVRGRDNGLNFERQRR